MMHELCCVVCPRSCHIQVTSDAQGTIIHIEGNSCPRGEAYAKSEAVDPQRMVTTTVRIHKAELPLLPVITSRAISKSKMFAVMEECRHLEVTAPVQMGAVLVENIAESHADLIASRSMKVKC